MENFCAVHTTLGYYSSPYSLIVVEPGFVLKYCCSLRIRT
jgi:hypothetical protein